MKFNVVLYNPEIPQNTGNIMRTCVATNFKLHLIKPLGFKLDEKSIKRSGVNYIDKLEMQVYENFDEFKEKNKGVYFYLTRYGKVPPTKINFLDYKDEDIYLIFGKESTGIPYDILRDNLDFCFRYPMTENVRSLNLSNTVAITVYEVLRQFDYPGLSMVEPECFKGEDFLLNFDKKDK